LVYEKHIIVKLTYDIKKFGLELVSGESLQQDGHVQLDGGVADEHNSCVISLDGVQPGHETLQCKTLIDRLEDLTADCVN
jgi:hypothetical protein